jgi:hypothetical protein
VGAKGESKGVSMIYYISEYECIYYLEHEKEFTQEEFKKMAMESWEKHAPWNCPIASHSFWFGDWKDTITLDEYDRRWKLHQGDDYWKKDFESQTVCDVCGSTTMRKYPGYDEYNLMEWMVEDWGFKKIEASIGIFAPHFGREDV